jgi:sugar lactone lactonase YvrE
MKASLVKRFLLVSFCAALCLVALAPPHTWGAETKAIKVVDPAYKAALVVPGTPLRASNGMNFDDEGNLLVAHISSSRISKINVDTGAITTLVDFERGVLRADDLTSDGKGTIWTSCSGIGGESIFKIDKQGKITILYSGFSGVNGIQYNRRTGRLFMGQFASGNGLYEIDPDGAKPARLVTSKFGYTNAMDFDKENNILLTVPGGKIAVVNPDTGESRLLEVSFPHNSALKVGPQGDIYVTGYKDNFGEVWKVSPDGKTKTSLSSGVIAPLDNLAVSRDNRLFVSSLRDATIYEVATDGSGKTKMFAPLGPATIIFMAAKGNDVYTSDGYVVRRLNEGKRFLEMTKGSFYERKGFPAPGSLYAGPGDFMYLTTGISSGNNQFDARIYMFSTKDFTFQKVNPGMYQGLRTPMGFCVKGSNIYATEFLPGEVTAIDAGGDESKRKTAGKMLAGPVGVVEKGNKLYVAESLGQRISVLDLATGRQDVLLTGLIGRPTAIDLDKEGNLLILDANGRRLLRVHPANGKISVIAENLPIFPTIYSHWPLIALPNALAVTENGVIYIGGNDDGSVWKITK